MPQKLDILSFQDLDRERGDHASERTYALVPGSRSDLIADPPGGIFARFNEVADGRLGRGPGLGGMVSGNSPTEIIGELSANREFGRDKSPTRSSRSDSRIDDMDFAGAGISPPPTRG